MRYAIWAAVSTEAQAAEEKASLTVQLETCRRAAADRHWREAAVYTVPGESRTRWVNLRDAEDAIPALRAMLDDARDARFDVLLMYDFNRLRDLLDPVARSLAAYGVQLFSVAQPVEPVPPEQYNPHTSDASAMMQGLASIVSKTQIADLRRKYNTAMPRRITERGLPHKIPYGYQKPTGEQNNPNAIPQIDPTQAQVLTRAKDLLLSGVSLNEICRTFMREGIPSPSGKVKWHVHVLGTMLRDPFYCGLLRWRRQRVTRDPRDGSRRVVTNDPARVITAQGKHTPLWDESTWRTLSRESARPRTYRGNRANQFSGLLACGVCGAPVHVTYNSHIYEQGRQTTPQDIIFACAERNGNPGHPRVRYTPMLQMVAAQLAQDATAAPPSESQARQNWQDDINTLETRKKRLVDAYEAGGIDLSDYLARIRALDAQLVELADRQRALEDAASQADQREQARAYIAQNAPLLLGWLTHADPRTVNHTLRILIARITVHKDRIAIEYK